MPGSRESDPFTSDETADAVMAAGQAATGDVPTGEAATAGIIPRPKTREGSDTRTVIAVTLAGIAAFFNLYAIQPLLPLFEQIFHASKSQVGRTVSAATFGVALSAPFCGALAERFGRRRIIVLSMFLLVLPSVLAAEAGDLSQLIFWRFLQGLVTPGIFGVTIAYIAEEWPRHRVPHVMSIYVTGTVLGGFLGRFFTGVAATYHLIPWVQPSWRNGFGAMAVLDIVFGFCLWFWLPQDSPLPTRGGHRSSLAGHLRSLQLLATFAIGFNILFALVAIFTYVTFYLAAPPFGLSAAQLSMIFMVYLLGLVITPAGGHWIARAGSRAVLISAVALGILGVLLTLIPNLMIILVGLALCSSGVFVCQSAATTYIQREAPSGGRASAAGLYVMFYYFGGSVGGVLPGLLWKYGEWKVCVTLIVFVQLLTAAVAGAIWKGREA